MKRGWAKGSGLPQSGPGRGPGWFVLCLLASSLSVAAQEPTAQVCQVHEIALGQTVNDLQVGGISTDGNRILFTSAADLTGSNPQQLDQIYIHDLQSGELRQVSAFEVPRDPRPVRPDGQLRRIVFSSPADLTGGNPDGSSEIFLLETQTGALMQITDSPDLGGSGSVQPVISADGSRIAFLSDDDVVELNLLGTQVFVYSIAGQGFEQITELPDRDFGVPSLDAQGRTLAFVSREAGGQDRFVSVDLETSQERVLLVSRTLSSPMLSGDGQDLVFATNDDPTLGNADRSAEIYLIDSRDPQPVSLSQVTHSFRSQELASVGAPSISRDGGRIVFPSQIDLTGRNPDGSFQLFSFDLEEKDLVQVTRGESAVVGGQVPVSADGSRTAFVVSLDTGGSPQAERGLRWAECSLRPSPTLVFPQIADGGEIRSEIILTNPGRSSERGTIYFRDRAGGPLQLSIQGNPASQVEFAVSPGGTFKLVTDGGDLKLGYAEVFSQNVDSRLTGSLIFSLNGEVSVTGSEPSKEFHVFTESTTTSRSGMALVNVSTRPADIHLTLRDSDGGVLRDQVLPLESGEGTSAFVDELFPDAPAQFSGSVHVRSDRFFAMMGLRQRSDLSLSGLSGAPSAFPSAGSQLLFLLDTGIDLTALNLTPQQLAEGTVSELSGFSASQRPHLIELINIHPSQAVTVHLRFFNDRCRDVFNFLLVLDCGERRLIDPFDMTIPGSTVETREWIFEGGGLQGSDFRSGRFSLTVTAVGASRNIDQQADLLRPVSLSETQQCAPGLGDVGTSAGLNPANLHLCNARPMAFDYLLGRQISDDSPQACQGPSWLADEELRAETQMTRQLVSVQQGASLVACLQPPEAMSCPLLESLNELGSTSCGEDEVGPTLMVKFPFPTRRLLPDPGLDAPAQPR
ncbi:MAG TPA: hypothetical protein VLV83_22240 [Acidobacteriota bacterium]|nr:hypothetical protein [Acidobacteriota bacterium]